MRFLPWFLAIFFLTTFAIWQAPVRADVIVLANRAQRTVEARVKVPGNAAQTYKLAPGEVVPVAVVEEAEVEYNASGSDLLPDQKKRRVAANSIVYFMPANAASDIVRLVERGFSGNRKLPAKPKPVGAEELARLRKIGVIPVKIFVDDDEPAVKMVWEKRLKDRLEQASDVLQAYCRIRLKAADTGTWDSQDGITDFAFSIREFEKEVRPGKKAALAIGFTSQYEKPSGRVHMGGTRGPMHPFILIREWSQHVAYSERLEIVVHEMGHVLGAAHSPDVHSVMRPLVSDGNARARSYKIGFDPLNTLAMYLFCEELRLRNVSSIRQFRPERRDLLCRIYGEMQKEMPNDTSAQRYITILKRASEPLEKFENREELIARVTERRRRQQIAADPSKAKTLISAAGIVAETVRLAAESKQGLEGDRLTEFYVQQAAQVAEKLPPELAPKALLLGLAVGLSRCDDFQGHAALGHMIKMIESDQNRKQRLEVLGTPTMDGRSDLTQHFMFSAALTALVGKESAWAIGVAKETADSNGGTGFSFRDLSANLAGICFAEHLMASKLKISDVKAMFCVDGFLPSDDDLPEGLSRAEFEDRFGSTADKRFKDEKAAIARRITTLSGYSLAGR